MSGKCHTKCHPAQSCISSPGPHWNLTKYKAIGEIRQYSRRWYHLRWDETVCYWANYSDLPWPDSVEETHHPLTPHWWMCARGPIGPVNVHHPVRWSLFLHTFLCDTRDKPIGNSLLVVWAMAESCCEVGGQGTDGYLYWTSELSVSTWLNFINSFLFLYTLWHSGVKVGHADR